MFSWLLHMMYNNYNNKYIMIFLLPEELILEAQRTTLVRHRDADLFLQKHLKL